MTTKPFKKICKMCYHTVSNTDRWAYSSQSIVHNKCLTAHNKKRINSIRVRINNPQVIRDYVAFLDNPKGGK